MHVTLSDLVEKNSTIETNMSRPQKITNTAKKIETPLASSFRKDIAKVKDDQEWEIIQKKHYLYQDQRIPRTFL
ncbi:hypothetical protein NC652_020364 [Populus alba x Populus x berolinensis]|nr:hypothetical protein NC652_020364 [Populus alba x Populus x berolinensis]